MGTPEQAQPQAQGDLSRTPFAHVLLYVHQRGLAGTLVIEREGVDTRVVFRDGRAVAAKPLPRGTELAKGLLELCLLPAGAFAFWDGDLVGDAAEVVRGTVDPFTFLNMSLRRHVRDAVVASVLDRYGSTPLSLTRDYDPRRLALRPPQAGFAEMLRARPMDVATAVAQSRLPEQDTRRLLYLLLITHCAAPAGEGMTRTSGVRAAVTPSPLPQAAPPAEPGPVSRPASHRPTARGAARSSSAPPRGIRSSGPPSAPSGAAALRRGSSLPAWKQLASMRAPGADPGARAPTPSMAPPPVETLDPAGKLSRAEQLAERKNYFEAMRIIDGLIREDDTIADYHVSKAGVLLKQFAGQGSFRKLHGVLDEALRLDSGHVRGLYLRGLAYKLEGREAEAISYFRRALAEDPDHLEARREMRLARMRRRK
ncbi:MAG: DUF4388 domain-containing protein [Myxococcales bacterium]